MYTMPKAVEIITRMVEFDRKHPHGVSFSLSVLLMTCVLFRTPSLVIINQSMAPSEDIQFINIADYKTSRRVAKRVITSDNKSVSTDNANIDRAEGISDEADAVDMAYYPSIAPPRPIGRLKRLYPQSAKKMNLEAIVYVELFIAKSGIVKNVNVLGVRLTRKLPEEIRLKISREFTRDAVKILLGAQFSNPIVNGRNVPVKMEMPLIFRLL